MSGLACMVGRMLEEEAMTLDECHSQLVSIRRQQGTRYPRLRIDCGNAVLRGRLARTDSDPEHRIRPLEPAGAIVLEDLTLGRDHRTLVPIEEITPGGIQPLDQAS
jgi:hypothetical protein